MHQARRHFRNIPRPLPSHPTPPLPFALGRMSPGNASLPASTHKNEAPPLPTHWGNSYHRAPTRSARQPREGTAVSREQHGAGAGKWPGNKPRFFETAAQRHNGHICLTAVSQCRVCGGRVNGRGDLRMGEGRGVCMAHATEAPSRPALPPAVNLVRHALYEKLRSCTSWIKNLVGEEGDGEGGVSSATHVAHVVR